MPFRAIRADASSPPLQADLNEILDLARHQHSVNTLDQLAGATGLWTLRRSYVYNANAPFLWHQPAECFITRRPAGPWSEERDMLTSWLARPVFILKGQGDWRRRKPQILEAMETSLSRLGVTDSELLSRAAYASGWQSVPERPFHSRGPHGDAFRARQLARNDVMALVRQIDHPSGWRIQCHLRALITLEVSA